MRKFLIICILCFPVHSLGADRFILQSELRTTYSNGSTAKVYTGYTYDSHGNRILKAAYNGEDSFAAVLSKEMFIYNSSAAFIEDILISATGDTLSIVKNNYGSSGLVSVTTLGKDNVVRF